MPWWAGVWAWLKKIPGDVWFVVCLIGAAAIGIYDYQRRVKKQVRTEVQVEDLQRTVELHETKDVIIHDIEKRVEAAETSVARMPSLRSRDELRRLNPKLADKILGPVDGNDGGSGS